MRIEAKLLSLKRRLEVELSSEFCYLKKFSSEIKEKIQAFQLCCSATKEVILLKYEANI